MLRRFWNWIKRLFHRSTGRTKQVPFHPKPVTTFHIGRSRSMIVRAGRSMMRGRLLEE